MREVERWCAVPKEPGPPREVEVERVWGCIKIRARFKNLERQEYTEHPPNFSLAAGSSVRHELGRQAQSRRDGSFSPVLVVVEKKKKKKSCHPVLCSRQSSKLAKTETANQSSINSGTKEKHE